MPEVVQQFDTALLRWTNGWVFQKPLWDAGIVFRVEFLGYWVLAGLLAFGVLALLPRFSQLRKKNWELVGLAFAAALAARYGVVELIRAFYNRPRPFEILPDLNQLLPFPHTVLGTSYNGVGAFPSGHAAFYFAIAAVISRYYPKTSFAFFAATISLSFARVVVGLHWPSDIIAGAAIGIAIGFLTHWLAKKYLRPKPAA